MGAVGQKLLIEDEWNQFNLMQLKLTLNELPKDKSLFEECLQYYKDLEIRYHQKECKTTVKIMIEIPNHHKKPLITDAIENYIQIRESEFRERCYLALKQSYGEHEPLNLEKRRKVRVSKR